MKDTLVKSNYNEFTHVRLRNGQVYTRGGTEFPRVDVCISYSMLKLEPFLVFFDKSGDIHCEVVARYAHLLGVEFLMKRPVIAESFMSDIAPFKTHNVDNHGHEYEVVDQWCIPIPKGVICNPEGMKVRVELVEVRV